MNPQFTRPGLLELQAEVDSIAASKRNQLIAILVDKVAKAEVRQIARSTGKGALGLFGGDPKNFREALKSYVGAKRRKMYLEGKLQDYHSFSNWTISELREEVQRLNILIPQLRQTAMELRGF